MILKVTAVCRQRGAIGIVYKNEFLVTNTSMSTYKDDWFKQFGDAWELNHFVSVTPEMSAA